MKKKNSLLLASMGIILTAGAVLGTSLTIAGFAATRQATRTVKSTAGEMKVSIFLDSDALWDRDGAIVYMKAFKTANLSLYDFVGIKRDVSAVISGNEKRLHVFEFDTTVYSKFIFIRFNPTGLNEATMTQASQEWNYTYIRAYDTVNKYNYFLLTEYVASPDKHTKNNKGIIAPATGVTSNTHTITGSTADSNSDQ